MTDIAHIRGKKDNQYLFEIKLNWLTGDRGILTANDVRDTVRVALPPVFGGEGDQWSPEHLFLGAISSCYMTSYLVFAKEQGFTISHFDCDTIGEIELVKGKYQFTIINVHPKIYIADEADREKAVHAMEKTQQYCLIASSIKPQVIYHSEIIMDKHPRINSKTGINASIVKNNL